MSDAIGYLLLALLAGVITKLDAWSWVGIAALLWASGLAMQWLDPEGWQRAQAIGRALWP